MSLRLVLVPMSCALLALSCGRSGDADEGQRVVRVAVAANFAATHEELLLVLEIADLSPSNCLVRLGHPSAPDGPVLLARITRNSLIQLGLKPGREIFARVKSVTVLD